MGIADQINRPGVPDDDGVVDAWNRLASADPDLRRDLGILIGSLSRSLTDVMARLVEFAEYVDRNLIPWTGRSSPPRDDPVSHACRSSPSRRPGDV
jgi:hypothetical protein